MRESVSFIMLASHRVTPEQQGVPEITALGTFLMGVVI